MSKSRLHHYVFGHITLRQIFFHNPPGCVAALREEGDRLLQRIWNDVGDRIEKNEEGQQQISPIGLSCTHREIASDSHVIIVSLPQPEEITEVHFVGLVIRPPKKKFWGLVRVEKGVTRYITLEYGKTNDGTPRTVLCEWIGERHVNMGDGPKPTVDDFAGVLAELAGIGGGTKAKQTPLIRLYNQGQGSFIAR